MRNLLDSVQSSNVIQGVNAGRQATVKAKDLVVDESGEGEVVEDIGEVFPDVGIAVFSQALVIKPVDLGDLPGLVVPSQNGDALWVSDLESNEQGDSLDRVVASVDVITYWTGSASTQGGSFREPSDNARYAPMKR